MDRRHQPVASAEPGAGADRRLGALVANSLDAIALFDAEGRILFATRSIERVQGFSAEEFIGTNAFDYVHPADMARMRRTFEQCVARRGEPVTAVFRARHRSGSWRTVEAVVASGLDDPEVGGVVANFRDISERVQLEARLLETQKMEAIGRLASGVAHDFNNLLAAILGFGALLADRAGDDPRLAPAIGEIRKAGERARKLTAQLLTLGGRQESYREAFDPAERLKDVEELLRRLAGDGIELRLDLDPDLGRVVGDPGRLEQAVVNLVVNSRDALSSAGSRARVVTVAARAVELDEGEARRPPEVPPGRYVLLSVADTGTGIAADVLPHVFEPFFTTKGRDQGTGLGLATVYSTVRQMDGFVEVESEPGAGTEVRIFLPRESARSEAVEASRSGSGTR